jgi:hypothetical protein
MQMMVVWIGAIVYPPTFGGSRSTVNSAVPDYAGHAMVVDDLLRKQAAVHAMGGIVGEIEGIAIVVVALALLMGCVAHDPVPRRAPIRPAAKSVLKCFQTGHCGFCHPETPSYRRDFTADSA